MVTFSASIYTIILPLLSCFIFALISAFVILAQCGGSKGKKQVGQQAAPRQPQKPGQQRPGPPPLGQPKPGTAAQKGKPTAKPAWTAKEKTKTTSTAKKLGGKKDKKATIPTTGKKTADPKFGAIDSDLMSYEAANLQLRRPKIPDPAFPKGTKAPVKSEKAQPNEAKQQIKPGTGNTPDYDTLNFIKAQDIFGKPKGEADVGAGHKEAAPPQSKDEDKEEDNNEEAGVQAGMADTGDYETLAQLDTEDIFKKK